MTKDGVWSVGGFELKLTNLDKVIFKPKPATRSRMDDGSPVTKRELIRYFARIAPTMLPHLAGAPAELPALPERCRRARLLAEGHPLRPRRHGCGAGRRSASRSARRTIT